MKKINYKLFPDKNGRFAEFGGKYVSETLMYPLSELEKSYKKIGKSVIFKNIFSSGNSSRRFLTE